VIGHTIIILPFGLLPLVFLVVWIFFTVAEERAQKTLLGKLRYGITEFPTTISKILEGTGKHEITYTNNGRSLALAFASVFDGIENMHEATEFIRKCVESNSEVDQNLMDHYIVEAVERAPEKGICYITVTLPDKIVLSDTYVAREIINVGRVFKRNDVNAHRWLLYRDESENRVVKSTGHTLVYINRRQCVPGFFGERYIMMSERQITRNIRNRLWNRFDVKCVSIDKDTYCGELIKR